MCVLDCDYEYNPSIYPEIVESKLIKKLQIRLSYRLSRKLSWIIWVLLFMRGKLRSADLEKVSHFFRHPGATIR